ncbi:MAG: peptidase MA family metallohydrolase [Anaerolineaceae bacterium]|nr:peptidase MA family metallohydrolase [Anaerolineaceae bacterium]
MSNKTYTSPLRFLKKLVLALFASIVLVVSSTFPAGADSLTLNISVNEAVLSFPHSIQFTLSSTSPSTVEKVALIYGTSAQSCFTDNARQDIDFRASKSVNATWTWDLTQSRYLPPGSSVWWQWEVQDGSGQTFTSPINHLSIEDPNFSWKIRTQDGLTVYWSRGDEAFGKMIMDKARSSLLWLSKNAGVQPPDQIQLTIYPSVDDVIKAVPTLPDWTGGVAFPEYNSILIGIAPGQTAWAAQVLPHELAHLVTHKRISNCQGASMPTWLDEGISVFAQGPTSAHDKLLVAQFAKGKILPRLISMSDGFDNDAITAEVEYAESGMLVGYMVDKFGANKLDTLLGAIQQGQPIDAALQQVYGLDTAGLEQSWRASMGYGAAPAQGAAQASPTVHPSAIPTLALWTPVVQVSSDTPTQAAMAAAQITPAASAQPASPTAAAAPSLAGPSGLPGWFYAGIGFLAALLCMTAIIVIRSNHIIK